MSIYNIIKTKSNKQFHNFVLNIGNVNAPVIFKEYDTIYSKKKYTSDYSWSNEFFLLYFIWIQNSLNNKSISIRNPFNNKVISTDRYFIYVFKKNELVWTAIAHYCFYDNIIMGLGLGTGCGGLESKILYIICLK